MTLPASGAISFSNINTELGFTSTAQISMNDANVRTLFGQASGAICMNTGHGKSNTSLPGVPTGVSASATGATTASVSFSAPACTGHLSIDLYRVKSSPGCFTATGASSPITVSGLTASTSYTFRVQAHNSLGYGCYSGSSNSVTTSAPLYACITTSGATVITCGNFKTAYWVSNGYFQVNSLGSCTNFGKNIGLLVVSGGGGGGSDGGGGGASATLKNQKCCGCSSNAFAILAGNTYFTIVGAGGAVGGNGGQTGLGRNSYCFSYFYRTSVGQSGNSSNGGSAGKLNCAAIKCGGANYNIANCCCGGYYALQAGGGGGGLTSVGANGGVVAYNSAGNGGSGYLINNNNGSGTLFGYYGNYVGGGGGGGYLNVYFNSATGTTGGFGGSCVGGTGVIRLQTTTTRVNTAGSANLGGGGGGGYFPTYCNPTNYPAKPGGSGMVAIRWRFQ